MFPERRDGVVGEQKWRTKVEREDSVDDLGRHVVDRRARGVDGVVDEDVDFAEPLDGDVNQPPAVVDAHQVRLLEDRVSAKLLGERGPVGSRQAGQDDLRAFFDKEGRDCCAQSLRAAGDDRDFTRQELTHLLPLNSCDRLPGVFGVLTTYLTSQTQADRADGYWVAHFSTFGLR